MPSPVKVYFDGGCRPNPGAMETAVVVGGQTHVRCDLGQGSGMDAEWLALIHAFSLAQSLGLTEFILVGDAAAVIAQARGDVKCPGSFQRHSDLYRTLVATGAPPRLRHVKRAQNLAGVALAKLHPR